MKNETYYIDEIKKYHASVLEYPDNNALKAKLNYRVKKWIGFLDIRAQVANNEQTPWTSEMIGYHIEPMPTKKDTGFNQVGDYMGVVKTPGGDWYIPLLCERKSIPDLCGTLVVEENRERFYREIGRFKSDPRFDQMVVIVEGTLAEFLMWYPPVDNKPKHTCRMQYLDYHLDETDGVFEKKITILADLFEMQIPILFCDVPALAARMYGRMVRETIRKQYWKLLKLETTS